MTAPITPSERVRLWREEQRRAGRCLVCGGERDRSDALTCSHCLRMIAGKTKLMRARREAAGLCPVCGGEREPGDRRKLCAACRAKANRANERRRQQRRERMDQDSR